MSHGVTPVLTDEADRFFVGTSGDISLLAGCRPTRWTPERRLMAAVLLEAMDVASRQSVTSLPVQQGETPHARRRRARLQNDARTIAREWFAARHVGPFAFLTICEELNLEADAVRMVVLGEGGRNGRSRGASRG